MRRVLLALSCLALVILVALVLASGLGAAQDSQSVEGARPRPTPDGTVLPDHGVLSPDVPAGPDLVVESITVEPAVPVFNEPALIRVTIKNQGAVNGPVTATFYTDLYIDPSITPIELRQDGDHAWGCQLWWVPAGESYTLEWTYVFTDVKPYRLYAQVDTDATVQETNEDNNVFGPVRVDVVSPNIFVLQTHEDFQMGMASNLDLSHPDGVIRRGIFVEPHTEPEVYRPDAMINDVTGTWTVPYSYTTVMQVKPALTGDGSGTLFAVWEDGRNGLRPFYEAARMFFDRRPDLSRRELETYAGALLREVFPKDPRETVKLGEYLARKARDPDLRGRALFAAGVVEWHIFGNKGKTERRWRRALGGERGSGRLAPRFERGLLLLLSDLVKSTGRKEEADRLFEHAVGIALKEGELRRGESEFRFRHYLRGKEFGRAWEALYDRLVADPVALREGEISLCRAELLHAMGRDERALAEIERVPALKEGAGRSGLRKRALRAAAAIYRALGMKEKARSAEEAAGGGS